MMAGLEMGLRFGLSQALGVFDARMPRIYGRLGHSPDVIGTTGAGRDAISVGLWEVSEQALAAISRRSGIPTRAVARWFDASFDRAPRRAARHRRLRDAGPGAARRLEQGHGLSRRIRRGRGTASSRCCTPPGSMSPRRRCCPTAAGRSRRWR